MMGARPMLNPPSAFLITASVCYVLSLVGAALHIAAAVKLRAHLRARTDGDPLTPPLTLWRALKPGVPGLVPKLDALVRSSRAGDQILLGADGGSAELAECDALRARWPEREIAVVPCEPGRAANPKISKFLQMAPHARHDLWLTTDSEAMVDAEFVEGFRREWAACGAEVLTAGYRFSGADSLPQTLDVAPALLTLWPGLMLTRRVAFTLGACTGVKAGDVRALGGWERFADELAEDHQLGALLAQLGRGVVLSRHVLMLDCDPLGWRDYLRHQHRVAVTYRAANPAGALGLPILHAFGLALLAACLEPGLWLCPALVYLVRLRCAIWMAKALGFPIRWLPLALPVCVFVESICWLLAWFTPFAYWAGRWWRLGWRGRLRP